MPPRPPEGDFTIIDRKDGTKIWAYKGWPLYLWIKDTKPGETTGDGVGGVWHTAVEVMALPAAGLARGWARTR